VAKKKARPKKPRKASGESNVVDFAIERVRRRLVPVQPDERGQAVHDALRAAARFDRSARSKDQMIARLIRSVVVPAGPVPFEALKRAIEMVEIETSGRFKRKAGMEWCVQTCRAAFLAGLFEDAPTQQEQLFRRLLRNRKIDHAMYSSADAHSLCEAMAARRIHWLAVQAILGKHGMRSSMETLRKMWEAEHKDMRARAAELTSQLQHELGARATQLRHQGKHEPAAALAMLLSTELKHANSIRKPSKRK
jgi:hypothetical protein